ncbi:MAG TPA: hypothetical protein VH137_10940 [Gemmatimonadales bacterium]|nr:hypothetical protein [Gemmatimonadales bacterium]
MNRIQSERGVALGMVLLVTVVLTLVLAAGFAAMSGERRVVANDETSLDAFALAQNGLELFMTKRDSFGFAASPPAVSESTRATFGGGYVDIVLKQVRADAANNRYGYAIRAHGVNTDPALSGTPQGERTVGEYAVWQVGNMNVLSGWTSLTGLQKNGNSGTLSGDDGCNKVPPVAGVAVPTNPGYIGPPGPVSGNPPVQNLGTQQQAVQATKINWDAIVNQNAVQPDYTIPPDSWGSINFAPSSWPVIKVIGDFTLPGAGQGTLIVTGNLTVTGSNMWQGVILAGGNVVSNGNNTVEGAVVSGLNVQFGQSLPIASIGNGTKTYQYNSCNVASAMAKQAKLVPYTNAWVDNWPTY